MGKPVMADIYRIMANTLLSPWSGAIESEMMSNTCSLSATTAGSATVRMNCAGRNWCMELSFSGYNSLVGSFYKEGAKVCDVSGSK